MLHREPLDPKLSEVILWCVRVLQYLQLLVQNMFWFSINQSAYSVLQKVWTLLWPLVAFRMKTLSVTFRIILLKRSKNGEFGGNTPSCFVSITYKQTAQTEYLSSWKLALNTFRDNSDLVILRVGKCNETVVMDTLDYKQQKDWLTMKAHLKVKKDWTNNQYIKTTIGLISEHSDTLKLDVKEFISCCVNPTKSYGLSKIPTQDWYPTLSPN